MRTIMIIDDDARFRVQARDLLTADGYVVVGEAADGSSGLELARSLRPDVVLVDVGLPDIDGFEVARSLARLTPQPAVVLTSSRDVRAFGRRLADGAALGFLPKEQVSGGALSALLDPP